MLPLPSVIIVVVALLQACNMIFVCFRLPFSLLFVLSIGMRARWESMEVLAQTRLLLVLNYTSS